jgi:hypothetical protein
MGEERHFLLYFLRYGVIFVRSCLNGAQGAVPFAGWQKTIFALPQKKLPFMRIFILSLLLCCLSANVHSQYWQQRAENTIEVALDHLTHRYKGTQRVMYYNRSPDTLFYVYFHLYNNAFQPGSMMDVRSRTIEDPDPRVTDRIAKLSPEEQGILTVTKLSQNGRLLSHQERHTLCIAPLDKPILPGKKAVFEMEFEGQVPVQIRRNGRNNREGVAYSMAQWYPRIAEYDRLGWHTHPYVGREFHGVWGNYDVKITMDSSFTIAATGVLQNAREIGKGYLPKGERLKRPTGDKLTWHFRAINVHDFAWGADPQFVHLSRLTPDGVMLRFFFKDSPDLRSNWEKLPEYTEKAFAYMSKHYGRYPYPEYAVVQGGDGGMEYPMLTFITGKRKLGSLVGVTVHEAVHSWYQLILASNEALYPWMDEGFTTYVSTRVMNHLFHPDADQRVGEYLDGYIALAKSGKEEPMSRHADHYNTNYAYGAAVYDKGATFVAQLGYIMGEAVLQRGMLRYYNEWKFKHPDPFDFVRVMEKASSMQLLWYLDYMMHTTEVIDYSIAAGEHTAQSTSVVLRRDGGIPMPIDLDITLINGKKECIHIPLDLTLKAKAPEDDTPYTVATEWPWTHPEYKLEIPMAPSLIATIEIDASGRMADVDRTDNLLKLNVNNLNN